MRSSSPNDAELSEALLEIARYSDTRRALVVLGAILEAPGLLERLMEVLKPGLDGAKPRDTSRKPGARRSAGASL